MYNRALCKVDSINIQVLIKLYGQAWRDVRIEFYFNRQVATLPMQDVVDPHLSALVSRGSYPRTDTLVQIAQACGYTVELVRDGERIELETE